MREDQPMPQYQDRPGHIDYRDESGAQRMIGYVMRFDGEARTATCFLDVEDKHFNRSEIVHGGILASMLDNVCGTACSLTVVPNVRYPFRTVSLSINYLKPARKGRLVAKGRVVGGGRNLSFSEGEIYDEAGEVIATASATFAKSKSGKDPALPERSGSDHQA